MANILCYTFIGLSVLLLLLVAKYAVKENREGKINNEKLKREKNE